MPFQPEVRRLPAPSPASASSYRAHGLNDNWRWEMIQDHSAETFSTLSVLDFPNDAPDEPIFDVGDSRRFPIERKLSGNGWNRMRLVAPEW